MQELFSLEGLEDENFSERCKRKIERIITKKNAEIQNMVVICKEGSNKQIREMVKIAQVNHREKRKESALHRLRRVVYVRNANRKLGK